MDISQPAAQENNLLTTINKVRRLSNPNGAGNPIANPEQTLQMLLEAEMQLEGLMPWSSNYTFLTTLQWNSDKMLAIYKPSDGERPLWDFPEGSLCRREFASYLISQVLGWPNIPPTVLRAGPHGQGSVQLFIEAEYEAHYFNLRGLSAFTTAFKQIALFDYIVNNADRKGGHCLRDKDGRLWAIDHGLTFHPQFKLRTVIWEFCDEIIPRPLLDELIHLQQQLSDKGSELWQIMMQFISSRELEALKKRIDRLVSSGHFPGMHGGRNVPYPPI
ncbi:MAG: SCO1664 family protein [Chloroflexota bacterium]